MVRFIIPGVRQLPAVIPGNVAQTPLRAGSTLRRQEKYSEYVIAGWRMQDSLPDLA
jgi:hypothetical protein